MGEGGVNGGGGRRGAFLPSILRLVVDEAAGDLLADGGGGEHDSNDQGDGKEEGENVVD